MKQLRMLAGIVGLFLLPGSGTNWAQAPDPSAPPAATPPGTRDLKVDHRYLNLPIASNAAVHPVEIRSNGTPVHYFMASLQPDHPEWWSSVDLGPYSGSTVQIRMVDHSDSSLLGSLALTDQPKEITPELYHEALRPQFHFSARRGWLNDVNGPVFCNGQYHLFYQHSPYTWGGSAKHWGHAVSTDMVHWHEVQEAIWPIDQGQMYSGSSVVDPNNTSGLVAHSTTPIVLIYANSDHGGSQNLAFTLDGLNFEKYAGNPVIPPFTFNSRDPHAFWYEPGKHWVLLIYVGIPDPNRPDTAKDNYDQNSVRIYTSPNLKDWTQTDQIDGGIGHHDLFLAECPDLFPLAVPDQPGQVKWLLQGGTGEYYLGSFDGNKFTPDSPRQRGRQGDVYAAQTFNNLPDGREVQIIWMRAKTPGMPFNQCLSLPLELSLKKSAKGYQLAYAPIKELEQLRGPVTDIPAGPLNPTDNPLAAVHGDLLDVDAQIKPGSATSIVFDFRGIDVTYDVAKQTIQCRTLSLSAPPLQDGILHLRLLLDRTSLDIFAGDGTFYMPMAILPVGANLSHRLSAIGGAAEIVSLKVYPMKSAWDEPTTAAN